MLTCPRCKRKVSVLKPIIAHPELGSVCHECYQEAIPSEHIGGANYKIAELERLLTEAKQYTERVEDKLADDPSNFIHRSEFTSKLNIETAARMKAEVELAKLECQLILVRANLNARVLSRLDNADLATERLKNQKEFDIKYIETLENHTFKIQDELKNARHELAAQALEKFESDKEAARVIKDLEDQLAALKAQQAEHSSIKHR